MNGGKATEGRPSKRPQTIVVALAAVIWLAAIAAGYQKVVAFSLNPGTPASPPGRWPTSVRFQRNPYGPTIVMLAHPHCPCTRASLTELSNTMSRSSGVRAYVFFLRPSGFDSSWVRTSTWRIAERIPGVIPVVDENGVEAARFGAHTSGQVVVYDGDGALLFSGGVTPSRGHIGVSDGQRQIVALLSGERPDRSKSAVFGCALQDPDGRAEFLKK
jgi:hypothetical protein